MRDEERQRLLKLLNELEKDRVLQRGNVGLLDERQAARFLGVTAAGMRGWRANGGGPPYLRVGRGRGLIRYDPAGLRRWIDERASNTPNRE